VGRRVIVAWEALKGRSEHGVAVLVMQDRVALWLRLLRRGDDAMLRPCITCGVLVESASGCALHAKRPRSTPGRTGAGQAAFRDAVLAAAEYRCQATENGVRCGLTDPPLLDAHHLKRLCGGGTNGPSNGVCVCRHHHRAVELTARR
jgi:hypothetical protein